MYADLGLELITAQALGGIYIPPYPKEKSRAKWLLFGLVRKIFSILGRVIHFNSEYLAPELLVIGKKKVDA